MNARIWSQPVHISWQIAMACAGVTLGVIGVQVLSITAVSTVFGLCCGVALVVLALWRQRAWTILLAVCGGLLIGLWRGGGEVQMRADYTHVIGAEVTIHGTVADDPGLDKRQKPTYVLRDLSVNGRAWPGKIWIEASTQTPARRSDQMTVRAKLQEGFGSFSASMYRAQIVRVERAAHVDPALEIRDSFSVYVGHAIAQPAAGLGLGVLAGEKQALPNDIAEAFRTASLTHIVVASGYNLTILVRLGRRLFARISKFLATFVSVGLIVSFMAVTGNSPSMARAGLVALLSLAAWYYGRKFHPIILLLLAAAVTLLIQPSYGHNDLGWMLSFSSFAGVMLLAPVVQRYFFGDKEPGTIRQIAGETICAQIVTVPIIVLSFGYVSLVGLGANLVVVPFVPLAMLLTFISGIGAWLLPMTTSWIGLPAEWLLDAMIAVSRWFSALPWARVEVQWSLLGALGFYGVLIAAWLWMKRASKTSLYGQNIIE